jgi:hypothetical protein
MLSVRRLVIASGLLAVVVCLNSGCNMIPHGLRPEQTWKLNRGPNPIGGDPFFSVSDPLPVHADENWRGTTRVAVDVE